MRRYEIVRCLFENGMSLIPRGSQAALARRFQVSESTVSRDVIRIFGEPSLREQSCPFCAARALDAAGAAVIERGLVRADRWPGRA